MKAINVAEKKMDLTKSFFGRREMKNKINGFMFIKRAGFYL